MPSPFRETNGWKWPLFMVGYLFSLAYESPWQPSYRLSDRNRGL